MADAESTGAAPTESTTKEAVTFEAEYDFLARAGLHRLQQIDVPGLPTQDQEKEKRKVLQVSLEAFRRQQRYAEQHGLQLTPAEGEYELPLLDLERVDQTAEQVHQAYIDFHVFVDKEAQVMRKTESNDTINLLMLSFTKLKEVSTMWTNVNRLSSMHVCTIAEVFGRELKGAPALQSVESVLADTDLLFSINAALYDVWSFNSRQQEKNIEGAAPNPLFTLASYEEFRTVSQGGEPQIGWPQFITSYKAFLKANRETYALLVARDKNPTGTIQQDEFTNAVAETGIPGKTMGAFKEVMEYKEGNNFRIDLDNSKTLEDTEIDQLTEKQVRAIVVAQAKLELFKDEEILKGVIKNDSNIQKMLLQSDEVPVSSVSADATPVSEASDPASLSAAAVA